MTFVETVKGPIPSADLGRVLVHEHIFAMNEEYRLNYDPNWDEDTRVEEAARDLNQLKSLGIDTIFDPTVLGLGRYIPSALSVRQDLTRSWHLDEMRAIQPRWTGRHIPEDVVPALLERGLTEGDIDTILVKNPRRYFE